MSKENISPLIGKDIFGGTRADTEEELNFQVSSKRYNYNYKIADKSAHHAYDEFNIANQFAELEMRAEDAAGKVPLDTTDLIKDSALAYDEGELQQHLAEYIKIHDAKNAAWDMHRIVEDIRGMAHAEKGASPEDAAAYGKYVYDLIEAKQKGADLNSVKTPHQQKAFLERVLTTGDSVRTAGFRHHIDAYSSVQLALAKELFEGGFPDDEKLDAASKRYKERVKEFNEAFGSDKEQKLFETLSKKYAASLMVDMRATGRLPSEDYGAYLATRMNKESMDNFRQLSLRSLTHNLGAAKMWTADGVAMICAKLEENASDPKKLAETIAAAKDIAASRKTLTYVPMFQRMRMFAHVGTVVRDIQANQRLPQYQKFSEVDNRLRDFYKAVAPSAEELQAAEKMLEGMAKAEPARANLIMQRTTAVKYFSLLVKETADPTVEVAQSKKRIEEQIKKRNQRKIEEINQLDGGVAAADKIAENRIEVNKLAERGISVPESEMKKAADKARVNAHNEVSKKRYQRQTKREAERNA